jgi:16S rRNA (cytidine1402-2'-O)-methyltransferase
VESALYVVATPIGNLADISQRAAQVLGAVDMVAAEDTRHSGQLLAHLDIRARLVAYHDHSGPEVLERLCNHVCGGGSVALICDAGTPLLADPGYRLVRAVQDAGGRVVPVPGASALLAALAAAGLPTDRFRFEGFLPRREEARQQRLAALVACDSTAVIYEAPHRLARTLDDLVASCGPAREAVLARELTKRFETICRLPLAELRSFVAADANQRRGEIVLLLGPAVVRQDAVTPRLSRLLAALAEDLPPKRAAALLAEYTGLRKRELYDHLLALRDRE